MKKIIKIEDMSDKQLIEELVEQTVNAIHNNLRLIEALCDEILERSRRKNVDEKYNELILAVGNKHEGETRHQTALRYIKQAEESVGLGEPVSNQQ